jgi:hypothetical protein
MNSTGVKRLREQRNDSQERKNNKKSQLERRVNYRSFLKKNNGQDLNSEYLRGRVTSEDRWSRPHSTITGSHREGGVQLAQFRATYNHGMDMCFLHCSDTGFNAMATNRARGAEASPLQGNHLEALVTRQL